MHHSLRRKTCQPKKNREKRLIYVRTDIAMWDLRQDLLNKLRLFSSELGRLRQSCIYLQPLCFVS